MSPPREIFLDNNATTQPLAEVKAAVITAMADSFGNPSSSNRAGERSRRLLLESRESVAHLIGAPTDSLSFTSGATEANNWALQRTCMKTGWSLLTTDIEHSSIMILCDFLERQGTLVHRLSGPRWFYQGTERTITSPRALRSSLSVIMEDDFNSTPLINNEMIVRKRPTPTMINSRKKLQLLLS